MLRKELKKFKRAEFHTHSWMLEQFCHGWHQHRARPFVSPGHPRKVFRTNLHVSTIPVQPVLPLQARLRFFNNLLVLFILTIALAKVDHIEQCPIYGFQGMLPFSNITSNLRYFRRHFKYLTEKTEYKKKKA